MDSDQGGPLLLYVEDELITRDTVEEALREAGFGVVVAGNGPQGLDLLAAGPGIFRGLITDINLGDGADGWEVAKHARELNSGLPVIYVSAVSEEEWTSKGVPNSLMISKPFAPAQVVVAMSSLLVGTDNTP